MIAIRSLAIDYTRAFMGLHAGRLRAARRRGDAGASAMELAIITAIIVGLAIVVLTIVTTVVTNRSNQITTNNGKLP
jgi:multisubunit Na+/H+ antiporter MnhC subunit